MLVLPCEASSSSSSDADPIGSALADERTFASYAVSKGDLLEVFVKDIEWSAHSLEIIEHVKLGGEDVYFEENMPICDHDGSLALLWVLVNAVCLSIQSIIAITFILYCV